VVISGPETFEKNILPYVQAEFAKNPSLGVCADPLDDCMKHAFTAVKQVPQL